MIATHFFAHRIGVSSINLPANTPASEITLGSEPQKSTPFCAALGAYVLAIGGFYEIYIA